MLVIPVLDLLNGQAVHAVAGQRQHYQALNTALCNDAKPQAVVKAYQSLHTFTTIYLADLNAIAGQGNHRAVVEQLLKEFPATVFWLDAGFARPGQFTAWPWGEKLRPVIGSESQSSVEEFQCLLAACPAAEPLLSLDFKNGEFLGPDKLLRQTPWWPQDIIYMRLDKVGKNQGPENDSAVLAMDSSHRYFAAGGVRGLTDLQELKQQGYAGVLVASALHSGQLSATDIVMAE